MTAIPNLPTDRATNRTNNGSPAAIKPFAADQIVIALALGMLAICFAVFALRSSYWTPGFSIKAANLSAPTNAKPTADDKPNVGWTVTEVTRKASNKALTLPETWIGKTLVRACAEGSVDRCVVLTERQLLDTPLLLATMTQQWAFIKGQGELLSLGDRLVLFADDGASASIQLLPLSNPPFDERIAVQLAAGLLIYTMGCAMLAFVRRTPDVWFAFMMCAGYCLFMVMRVWYTDRVWAQPSNHWWAVLIVFKLGVLLCGCSCLTVIWRLRLQHRFNRLLVAVVAVITLIFFLHSTAIIDSVFFGYKIPTLICLVGILVASIYASFQGAQGSTEKASQALRSKYFVQIIVFGFVPAVALNALWVFRPDLPAIPFMNNFTIASAGIPVVILVTRSSQYGLQKFWWTLWLVLIVTTVALITAALVASISGLNPSAALIVAVAVASWIVYLLRQWLARKLLGNEVSLNEQIPKLMALSVVSTERAGQEWKKILVQAFEPHSSSIVRGNGTVAIQSQGDQLIVPNIDGTDAIILTGAANFTRAFNQADLQIANSLYTLAMQGLAARDSFTRGAVQERYRIAADLHDDIGGKLMHLANRPGPEGQYARHTLEDLRIITRGLSAQPRTLAELIADLQYQFAQRADRDDLEFDWQSDLGDHQDDVISGHQASLLASMGSELLRNVMQHPASTMIRFELRIEDSQVYWVVTSDGSQTDPTTWKSGLGTTSIRRRVNDLGGRCSWQSRPDGGVIFSAQWPLNRLLQPIAP